MPQDRKLASFDQTVPRHAVPVGRIVLGLITLCTAVELLLQGADHGLWGTVQWRGLAYQYGGFWPGLLRDWQPNFPGQPLLMFLSHSLLHAGFGHLFGNMVTLAALGRLMSHRVGAAGFLLLYTLSTFGGDLGFALLDHGSAPMVGSSGAIFGLAGALTLWDTLQRRQKRLWGRLALILAGLTLLNLVTSWLQGGNLAWQAHLGGFVTGFALAAVAEIYPPLLAKTRS